MIVVSDAGPLIHLSLVRSLDLLREIYGRILIPEHVYNEVVKKGEGLAGSIEVAEADWIELASHSPESDLFRLLRTHLTLERPRPSASLWTGKPTGFFRMTGQPAKRPRPWVFRSRAPSASW